MVEDYPTHYSDSGAITNKSEKPSEDEYLPIIQNNKDIRIAIIMVILGTGYLMPFECYLLSLDYYTMLYPTYKIYSTFPFVYMGAIAITFLFFLKFPNFSSHSRRMFFGFSFYIAIMVVVPIINMTKIAGSIESYIITLLLIIITGVVDGFVQGTVYSIAGLFGPQYTIFTQIGVGLAGIIVAIVKIISKVSFPYTVEGQKKASLLFFLIAAFILLFCLLSFVYLMKLPIGHNLRKRQEAQINKPKIPLKPVIKANLQLGLMNMYIFLVSMYLFPGVVMEIPPYSIRPDWFMVVLTTTYNVFDFIGKSIPIFFHKDGKNIPSNLILWAITIGRTVFFALFYLCVYTHVFKHAAWPITFLVIFGFSNGYVCSILMAEGPRIVKTDYKELSGLFMTTCLIIGLTIGSTLNFMVANVKDK
eukprot:gene17202-20501_t